MVAIEPAVLVGIGGALGALCRHSLATAVDREAIPLGTLIVNVVGSFVLGLVTLATPSEGVALLVGVGVCGAFTTFSSFAVETVRLWESGRPLVAVGNAVANLVGALAAVGLAWLVLSL